MSHSKVHKPIETRKVELRIGGVREVEIALPEVTTVRVHSQLAIEPGHYALLRGPKTERDRDVAVLVRVDRRDTPPPAPTTEIRAAPRRKEPEKH